jgi:hypothetical protein
MKKRYVWICGTFVRDYARGRAWELNGIFKNKKRAVARCRTAKDFVAKIVFDVGLPVETADMEVCEYPFA